MEIQKILDEAIEKLTSLRVELMKLDKDLLEEASKVDILLCKAYDQCVLCEHPYQSIIGEEHGNPKCLKCGENL